MMPAYVILACVCDDARLRNACVCVCVYRSVQSLRRQLPRWVSSIIRVRGACLPCVQHSNRGRFYFRVISSSANNSSFSYWRIMICIEEWWVFLQARCIAPRVLRGNSHKCITDDFLLILSACIETNEFSNKAWQLKLFDGFTEGFLKMKAISEKQVK